MDIKILNQTALLELAAKNMPSGVLVQIELNYMASKKPDVYIKSIAKSLQNHGLEYIGTELSRSPSAKAIWCKNESDAEKLFFALSSNYAKWICNCNVYQKPK